MRWGATAAIGMVATIAMPAVSAQAVSAETVRGTAQIAGVDSAVELRTGEGIGDVRYRPLAGGAAWTSVPLDTLAPVIGILADQRLAFLHEAITRWAGDDLSVLRDAMIARTRAAWEAGRAGARAGQPSQGAVRTRTRALLQYATALRDAGRWPEAIALLRQERDANPLKGEWDRSEWSSVSLAIAGAQAEQGRLDDAVATLDDAAARLDASPYAINADLQAASMLAMAGRYEAASRHFDRAERAFAPLAKRAQVVPGAMVQFDTVSACVLHGLGRTAEAATLLARIDQAAAPESRRYAPPPNRVLLERAAICMKDATALADVWRRDVERLPVGSTMLVTAQPGYRQPYDDAATLERARALLGAVPPLRILPDQYRAALDSWR
jgi:tetratricopeptide (TPR) repeat protein